MKLLEALKIAKKVNNKWVSLLFSGDTITVLSTHTCTDTILKIVVDVTACKASTVVTRVSIKAIMALYTDDSTINLVGGDVVVGGITLESEVDNSKSEFDDTYVESYNNIIETELYNSIRKVAPMMATNDVRYYLNGACFEFSGRTYINIIAIDGHRLGFDTVKIQPSSSTTMARVTQSIVPVSFVKTLLKIINKKSLELVKIFVYQDSMVIHLPCGATLQTKLIDGKYPDYQRVIPTEFGQSVSVGVKDTIKTLKTIALLTPGNYFTPIVISSNCNGRLVFTSTTQTILDDERVHYNATDNNFVISTAYNNVNIITTAFNIDYLIDALKAIDTKTAILKFSMNGNVVVMANNTRQLGLSFIVHMRVYPKND